MNRLNLLGLLFFSFACQDIDSCEADTVRSYAILRFLDFETKESRKIGFRITAENSPYVFRPTADSTAIGLLLNPSDTITTYFFSSDTSDFMLKVHYNVDVKIFDPHCPPSIRFTNMDTIEQNFDSLAIQNVITDQSVLTHFEAYF